MRILTCFFNVEFQKIPTAQETAQSILDNFVGYHSGGRGKRSKTQKIHEDIVVVLDASGSIGSCEFREGKKAMAEMMKMCPEKGPKYSCLFSAVNYSKSATEVFRSLPFTQATAIMNGIHYSGRSTNTAAALQAAENILRSGMISYWHMYGRTLHSLSCCVTCRLKVAKVLHLQMFNLNNHRDSQL